MGFRCYYLCGRHVQLPGLPCLCAPTLALWWWKGLSKWKWWALHSRLRYEHLWDCVWKKAAAASSDICFCSTHHTTFSLTFPIPGLTGSVRINQVRCYHHSSSAIPLTSVRSISNMHNGITHFKSVLMSTDLSFHFWDNITISCVCECGSFVMFFLASSILPPSPNVHTYTMTSFRLLVADTL